MSSMTSHDALSTVRVGPRGTIELPADLRRELGIAEESVLVMRVVGGKLVLESRENILRRWQERFRAVAPGVSLSNELVADRRREAAAEDQTR